MVLIVFRLPFIHTDCACCSPLHAYVNHLLFFFFKKKKATELSYSEYDSLVKMRNQHLAFLSKQFQLRLKLISFKNHCKKCTVAELFTFSGQPTVEKPKNCSLLENKVGIVSVSFICM